MYLNFNFKTNIKIWLEVIILTKKIESWILSYIHNMHNQNIHQHQNWNNYCKQFMGFVFLLICTHSLNGCILCFITYAIVTKDILHVIVKPLVGNYIYIFHSLIKFYVQVVDYLLCMCVCVFLIINLKVFIQLLQVLFVSINCQHLVYIVGFRFFKLKVKF
jgi:hypothetical protein